MLFPAFCHGVASSVSRHGEKVIWLFLFFFFTVYSVTAQKDSVHVMHEVTVTAIPLPHLSNTIVPVQTFDAANLAGMNVLQLSDVVKLFAGVTVKDYGGIGGLKTVSIRGLGPTHTAVNYDGQLIGDAQNGEIDLSKLSLDHVKEISLANGDAEDPLESARAFASAGLLSVVTLQPHLDSLKRYQAEANVQTGSFGWIHPSWWMANQWTPHLSSTLYLETQYANGRYPFTVHNGDSIQHSKRTNSDVHLFHGEANIFYVPDSLNKLTAKMYASGGACGLPGAVILYNPYAGQGQRLYDGDYFLQAQFTSIISKQSQYALSAKAEDATMHYVDPYFLNSSGGLDNLFRQQEYDLSGAFAQHLSQQFQMSLASDVVYNHLSANLYQFAQPSRFSSYSSIKGRYAASWFHAEAALLSTYVADRVALGTDSPHHSRLSPMVSMSADPFQQFHWEWRAFYKETFRMPTFNELYYTGIGNTKLKPETAQQWNVGSSYWTSNNTGYLSLSIDGYYNRVINKIVAVPSGNLFIWSMLNLGLVSIHGVDVTLRGEARVADGIRVTMEGSYSYQSALDKSNAQNSTYNQQIAYTPENSGATTAGMLMPWVNMSYTFLFSGFRYDLSHSFLPGYNESSVSLWRKFALHHTTLTVKGELLNLLNEQYAIVKNYPMPGRSWRVTAGIGF
jgi:outer membrane receptor protein involved in Fe transport